MESLTPGVLLKRKGFTDEITAAYHNFMGELGQKLLKFFMTILTDSKLVFLKGRKHIKSKFSMLSGMYMKN